LDSETYSLSGTSPQMVKLPGEVLTAGYSKPDPVCAGQGCYDGDAD